MKDRARLVAAYDDAAGVTAAFNRNVLGVLEPRARRALRPRRVRPRRAVERRPNGGSRCGCDRATSRSSRSTTSRSKVPFAPGKRCCTEIAAKFTAEQVREELWESGFVVEAGWTDPDGDFLLTLAHPYC